ncbi:hypothetical protein [Leptolyngbya iicbica]|uniref:Uncharacterized protein n=2 Tax=Cyanophyceae TaxID=3028117 RepID=A0A4Q7EA51_9CYAN|nr:hypothetical protein [Leptolyngbya sp. LK]RZM79522.1 hypothetical protein DYY88_12440 [Leptolyngbya sp. LK]
MENQLFATYSVTTGTLDLTLSPGSEAYQELLEGIVEATQEGLDSATDLDFYLTPEGLKVTIPLDL